MVEWVMVWWVFTLDRVTGELEVITVFSPKEAWDVFLSQSRLSRVVDGDRYKAWLESSILDGKSGRGSGG